MWLFWSSFNVIFISLYFKSGISCRENVTRERRLDCEKGTLLSKSVCVPEGYLQGEVPKAPTVVSTKLEINNIREINDKMMRITRLLT